jgi:predicted O-linked N-acetylglucosamine transferase (SPINDLY family)
MMGEPSRAVSAEEMFLQAVALHEEGKLHQAEQLYRAILIGDQDHLGALHNLGILCFQRGDYADAVAFTFEVVRQRPNSPAAYNTMAVALKHLGRLAEAEICCREAMRLAPDYAEGQNTLGDTLTALGRFAEAEAIYREAVRLAPQYAEAYNNLGIVLLSLGRPEEAEDCCRHALRLKPHNPAAFNNLGAILLARGRPEGAETCYREALRLDPANARAHSNLATLLLALGRYPEAEACYREALRLNPNDAAVYGNLGDVLNLAGELSGAVAAYQRAASLNPEYGVDWFYARKRLCDWTDYAQDEARILKSVGAQAFKLLVLSSTPAEQLACARRAAASSAVPQEAMFQSWVHRPGSRIRLGYLSSDFRVHAVSSLIAGVFEHHDRSRFEVLGYSTGPDDQSAMRTRVIHAFDRFVDLSKTGNDEAARLIHDDAIDILVDLNGFASGARTAILARRPAPIQVNYLGYPGTMGADFMDYIIGDGFVLPSDQQSFLSERVVSLPDCYQCNDDRREIAERTPSRAECSLPEQGFVFCCFNEPYKLTPTFFDIWTRLLRAVPESVLWLLETAPTVKDNLTRQAAAREIAPERLVFASKLPPAEHLARHHLADLFLDTLPYNAHTTASDALWAGLPLLTCVGDTFAGRVSGSLLRTVGVDELITTSLAEYEALALRLARDLAKLGELRVRLADNRRTYPLFDTARCTRNLEAAYWHMSENRKAGRSALAFSVGIEGEISEA